MSLKILKKLREQTTADKQRSAHKISDSLRADINRYISDYYVNERILTQGKALQKWTMEPFARAVVGSFQTRELDHVLHKMDSSFSETLLKLIDRSGKTDAEIYKKADVDRRLFSKIRSNKHYQPAKNTAIALAMALELDLDEANDLIGKAGYTLSRSIKSDLIIEYCIQNRIYKLSTVNEILYEFEQEMLGS